MVPYFVSDDIGESKIASGAHALHFTQKIEVEVKLVVPWAVERAGSRLPGAAGCRGLVGVEDEDRIFVVSRKQPTGEVELKESGKAAFQSDSARSVSTV